MRLVAHLEEVCTQILVAKHEWKRQLGRKTLKYVLKKYGVSLSSIAFSGRNILKKC